MKKNKMGLAVVVVLSAMAFGQQRPQVVGAEAAFKPGDIMHLTVKGEVEAGAKVPVQVSDASDAVVYSGQATAYTSGNDVEVDVTVPQSPPGHYMVYWNEAHRYGFTIR